MTEKNGNLTASDFHHELYRRFDAAAARGDSQLEVTAGELHKTLKAANRLSMCCNALYDMQNIGDAILSVPSGGAGSSLLIRYSLPRERGIDLEKSIYERSAVLSGYEMRMKRFIEIAEIHPVFRDLEPISRQKKSETATRKLCDITTQAAELICKHQKIRVDNTKFGTLCGAIGRSGILSDDALYALDFVRIIGNTNARKIPDEHLLVPAVFSYASYAFLIFAEEVIEKRLIWKKEKAD
ncbi:hypothetical protein SDC9_20446 [bioreactor metagenome]|uniref:Uncharacterized protein n=1 Tax=bioreactor metagenome TaxID=1076179 RepID=A0A644U6S2_9ZZZZ|nr:hypothetical protein [Methanocorpusculum sp.]